MRPSENGAFAEIPLQRVHTDAPRALFSFSPPVPLSLPTHLVLISTQLYIAGLSQHSCLRVTGKARSGRSNFEYTALSREEERKERKGEAGEEESAIDRQANTSQPLSPPLSIVSKC